MHTFSGKVIEGKKLGRTIEFPTANIALSPDNTDLSAGTYGLSGKIDGKLYYGIGVYLLDLGLFESHFFEFSSDIYGETLSITPLFKIRENQKFHSLDELKGQIAKDKLTMESWILGQK